jgi:hypothetical protein
VDYSEDLAVSRGYPSNFDKLDRQDDIIDGFNDIQASKISSHIGNKRAATFDGEEFLKNKRGKP